MWNRAHRFASLACAIAVLLMGAVSGYGLNAHAESAEDAPQFSFGLVADIQYADIPASGSRHYRASLDKLRDSVETFNATDLVCVMDVGDVVDQGRDSFADVMPIYEELEAPLHIALGNHDFPVSREHTLDALDMEESYYDLAVDGWRFIVLDGNDLSLLAWPEGSERHEESAAMVEELEEADAPNAQTWNGGLGADQLAWLEDTLDAAAEADEKVMLFGHFPVYPSGAHNLWNDEELVSLIEQHPHVVAYFNGHNHAGNYAQREGVHYVTLNGMVETEDENAFGVVDVYGDRVEITGYGRQPDRVLEIPDSAR